MSPRTVFEDLVELAYARYFLHCDGMLVDRCIRKGEEIPAKYKPGALLDRLTPEQREALKGLTSNDTMKYKPRY